MPQAVIPAAIGAVGAIGSSVIGARGAKDAAKATRMKPYAVSGPAGNMTVDGNQINLSQANNPFNALFQALAGGFLGNAAGASNAFLQGADPEVANAYRGLFGQGLNDTIEAQLERLRAASAPEEQRTRLGLDDQLYSRGQLGTTGGTERFRALEEALAQADRERQISAVGLGRQEALDRFTGAIGGSQQGMAGALQNFNMGMGAFGGYQQLLQNLFQQAGLGISAGGGQAPGAAMYAAQAGQAPWQAGFQFLQNSGMFQPRGNPFQQMAPMVQQPGGFGGVTAPDPSSWMPSGNFGL